MDMDLQGLNVRGTTRVFPVVGHPVQQVRAPHLFNEWFRHSGHDCIVVPFEIAPEHFATVLPALLLAGNVGGAMVTIPHKVATVGLLHGCSDAVRIAGACNAVVRRSDGRLYGELFDGVGLLRAAQQQGFEAAGARCLVVGAGGAGAAIAAALAAAGAASVRLFDTRLAHAQELAARLRTHYPAADIHAGPAALAGLDLLVNATPLGMEAADPPPVDVAQLRPQTLVAEIVMKRDTTPLLEAARAIGCRTVRGREMLQAQMPLYLQFFGLAPAAAEPDAPAMRAP